MKKILIVFLIDIIDIWNEPILSHIKLSQYTDNEIFLLWRNGNDLAFNEIYRRNIVKLLEIAIKKTICLDDAEELVQNAFIKLYQQRDVIKNDNNIFGYLCVILRNQVFNLVRDKKVQIDYETVSLQNPQSMDTLEIIEYKELESFFERVIQTLPLKCREVFILSRKKFLSNKQIAHELNISENTVEQHIRKAIHRLRISIKNFGVFTFYLFLKGLL